MLKGLGNLVGLMKQVQEMQGRIETIKEGLAQLRVEGTAGAGMIKVTATGQQKIVACSIDPALFQGQDREMIEDLFTAAANQALDKAREAAAAELQKATGNLDLPGLQEALSQMGLGG